MISFLLDCNLGKCFVPHFYMKLCVYFTLRRRTYVTDVEGKVGLAIYHGLTLIVRDDTKVAFIIKTPTWWTYFSDRLR